jgi:aryl-alcohol dehydrogenase-like predicted oxidoreductase
MPPTPPLTDLPTRRLGDSPLQVALVGLGCNNFGWRLDQERTAAVLDAALAAGITLFDTADIYGGAGASERLMSEALRGRREEYVLATKFGMEMHGAEGVPEAARGSREYIRWAVEGSLRRLQTDRIDLYQYHQPDGVTPIEETLEALDELVREGSSSRSAAPTSAPPSSRRPSASAASAAWPTSPPCRTTTACSSAASRPMWRPPASASASRSCPSSRSPRGC